MPEPGGPFLRHCWSTAARQRPRVHEAFGFAGPSTFGRCARRDRFVRTARANAHGARVLDPFGEQVGGGVRLVFALMVRTCVHG